MGFAGSVNGCHLGCGNLVRSDIASTSFHPDQWAIVQDEVVCEKCVRRAKSLGGEPPESASTYLGAGAFEPKIGRFGFSFAGRETGTLIPIQSRTAVISPNGTPVCAMPNGPGFMPRKTTFRFPAVTVGAQENFVGPACVFKRIVDVSHRLAKRQRCEGIAELACGGCERFRDGRHGGERTINVINVNTRCVCIDVVFS